MYGRRDRIGVIGEAWAAELPERSSSKFLEYNWPNGEEIYKAVGLELLGGLAVHLWDTGIPYERDEIIDIQKSRSVIDLAFGDLARVTSTVRLLEAAREQRTENATLIRQLQNRTIPTDLHSGNEAWFIPISAIELVSANDIEKSLV